MVHAMVVNLRSFRQKARHHKRTFRRFLTKFEKNMPRNADKLAAESEKELWDELNCLSCANCCKQMSPTYSVADIKRIAAHQDMSSAEFKRNGCIKTGPVTG
jgi:uncharacterized protein